MRLPKGTTITRYVLDGFGWVGKDDLEKDPSRMTVIEDVRILQNRDGGWHSRFAGESWIAYTGTGDDGEEVGEICGATLEVTSPTHYAIEGWARVTQDFTNDEAFGQFQLERWDVQLP